MSKEVFFFASKTDLELGLSEVESGRQVKYARTGLFDDREVQVYMSFSEIVDLGVNRSGNHQSESYLVLDQAVELQIREVPQSKGGVKYAIDQMNNTSSIVFWPGGVYKENFIICGHIATISNESLSLALYKEFSKKLLKGFKKVGRYYLSPEAFKMKDSFRYITMNINQPTEYDLKLD